VENKKMAKQAVDVMIEGGKATAAPPLGPALGPLKVNIGAVVAAINTKTADFKGMQVPVKITVDTDTKEFDITIGTPPASALIKKELGLAKGAANAKTEKVADMSVEQVIKISNMKADSLLGKTQKQRVKEIAGTCNSIGVYIDGQKATEFIKSVNTGKYDSKFK
jgi:large subunit ribosomal protein L11